MMNGLIRSRESCAWAFQTTTSLTLQLVLFMDCWRCLWMLIDFYLIFQDFHHLLHDFTCLVLWFYMILCAFIYLLHDFKWFVYHFICNSLNWEILTWGGNYWASGLWPPKTDGRTVGRTHGRLDGRTDRRTVGWTDRGSDGRTDRQTDGRLVGWMDGRLHRRTDCTWAFQTTTSSTVQLVPKSTSIHAFFSVLVCAAPGEGHVLSVAPSVALAMAPVSVPS